MKKIDDKVIPLKLVLGKDIIIISMYASQVGLNKEAKSKLCKDMDVLVQGILIWPW